MTAFDVGPWDGKYQSDREAITRLAALLQIAAIDLADEEAAGEYLGLRSALMRNPDYSDVVPDIVRKNPTLRNAAIWLSRNSEGQSAETSISDELTELWERVSHYELADSELDGQASPVSEPRIVEAVGWTGRPSRVQRLASVQAMLPIAQSSIQMMIDELSRPGDNGGPLLDETNASIEALRQLHSAIGELLRQLDLGHFDDELGEGLAAEVTRYAKKAYETVKADPIPFAASGLLLALLSTLGFPGLGGYLAGAALSVRKHGN